MLELISRFNIIRECIYVYIFILYPCTLIRTDQYIIIIVGWTRVSVGEDSEAFDRVKIVSYNLLTLNNNNNNFIFVRLRIIL